MWGSAAQYTVIASSTRKAIGRLLRRSAFRRSRRTCDGSDDRLRVFTPRPRERRQHRFRPGQRPETSTLPAFGDTVDC